MLNITLANLHSFCRICLRDTLTIKISHKPNHNIEKENLYVYLRTITRISTQIAAESNLYPSVACHSCYIKMIALDSFRKKCISNIGAHKLAPLEDLKEGANLFCRLCRKQTMETLGDQGNPELFDFIKSFIEDGSSGHYEKLSINDSRFPKRVCKSCASKLKTFMTFQGMAKRSEEYFKSLQAVENCIEGKNATSEQESVEVVDQLVQANPIEETSQRDVLEIDPLGRNDIESIIKIQNSNEEEFEFASDNVILKIKNDPHHEKNCNVNIHRNRIDLEGIKIESFNDGIKPEVFSKKDISETDPLDTKEVKPIITIENLSDGNKPEDFSQKDVPETDPLDTKEIKPIIKIENLNDEFQLASESGVLNVNNNRENIKFSKNSQSSKKPSKKGLRCLECDRFFYKQVMLDAHVKSVHQGIEKPFVCEQCPSAFRQHGALERHRSLYHKSKEPPAKVDCMTYLRQFKGNDTLVEDINSAIVDSGKRPFNCQFCQKGFASKRLLKRHEQNHSEQRSFACKFCKKLYNVEVELSMHVQRHIIATDPLCPFCKQGNSKQYCKKAFAHSRTQKEHEQLHDPTNRSVFCTLCVTYFKSRATLARHMTKEHNQLLPKKRKMK